MGMQVIRDAAKIFRIPSKRIVGRHAATEGPGEDLTPEQAVEVILPPQTGHVTEALLTDGTNVYWGLPTSSSMDLFHYRFSSTTFPPPSTGQVRYNNTVIDLVTAAYVNKTSDAGIDLANYYRKITPGTVFFVQEESDALHYQRWSITSVQEHAAYFEWGITMLDQGLTITNNTKVITTYVRVGQDSLALDHLTDVVITAPADNQVLTFDGTNWVNETPAGGGGGTVTHTAGPLTLDYCVIGAGGADVKTVSPIKWGYSAASGQLQLGTSAVAGGDGSVALQAGGAGNIGVVVLRPSTTHTNPSTFEFPNHFGTSIFATQGGTETHTNKTFTSPKINVGSDVTGDIYYRNAGGLFTRLGIGTATHVLTVTGGLPVWAAPPAGGVGTVTNTGGALTSNAVVLGAGVDDVKVSPGITTDGASMLTLGVSATTSGQLRFYGSTSGTATVRTPAFANNVTLTLPNVTGTIALQSQITGTNSGTNTGDQNIFQTIAVAGQSNVVADTTTDTLTLVAGTNITITTNAATDEITISAAGGGGNSFGTIVVAGQSNVVADAANDTLTLVAGSGITLTTNATTDEITITSSAGGGNVSNSGTPVANQLALWAGANTILGDAALTYNATTDTLTSVNFAGALVGNVTGNVSGSSGSCTGNSATVTTNANLTGPVTSAGNTTAITDKAVTLAKMADVATASVFYRKTAATGIPEVQTLATLKTDLGLTGTNSGDSLAFGTVVVSGQSNVVADLASDTLTLVAGTNITITTNATTDEITINATGGGGNSFTTIAISGQTSVVADSASDTLTFVAGSGITLTTNAATDEITITATSGALGLDGLTDVVITTPADGDQIVYNGTDFVNAPQIKQVTVTIDGGGAAITPGFLTSLQIPYDCTILEWTLVEVNGVAGNLVVDIWKSTLAGLPMDVSDTIITTGKPTLTTSAVGQGSTFTGWITTAIAAGDWLGFNVDSATTVTKVVLALKVRLT